MITYDRSAFGLNLIFRVHGSAIYRAIIPGLFSVITLILIRYFENGDGTLTARDREENDLQHPYAIGILISSVSFLIVFRASQGYARYWEAAGSLHQMMSKWMDATIHTGCYHMQCAHYDAIKPPSFFDYPELNAYYLTRDRERYREVSHDRNSHVMHDLDDTSKPLDDATSKPVEVPVPLPVETSEPSGVVDHSQRKSVAEMAEAEIGNGKRGRKSQFDVLNHSSQHEDHVDILDRAVLKSINPMGIDNSKVHAEREQRVKQRYSFNAPDYRGSGPIPLTGSPRLDGNWGKLFPDKKATYYQPRDTDPSSPNYLNNVPSFASTQGGRTPSLFLQELTHLCSLMNAVALSTMRNDCEGSASPLGVYKPGEEWPEVDPDKMDSYFLNGGPWYVTIYRHFQYFIGTGRTPEERTRYNAARPLEVIGGVSDAEIRFLQMARGPLAKTQLCWYWLTEFIIREHLNGSTGKVGPPIISRIIQFLSDGMIFYNHCRKIMFIPFPFPHAQLSVIFVLIAIPAVAFLMDQYCDNVILGSFLTFLSITALAGIHEVARELENPFRNIPNELPLVTFQAQFNEALIIMYSGYHPDHFWNPTIHNHHPDEPPPGLRKYGSKNRPMRASHTTPPTRKSSQSTGPRIKRAVSVDGASNTPTKFPSTDSNSATNANGPAVTPAAASETTTTNPAAAMPGDNTSTPSNLSEMNAKLEEYGREIARLTSLVNAEEKKSN